MHTAQCERPATRGSNELATRRAQGLFLVLRDLAFSPQVAVDHSLSNFDVAVWPSLTGHYAAAMKSKSSPARLPT
jgi:hypothetical protein